jgi:hypothetical protein
LFIDKFGSELVSPETIKSAVDRLAMMEKPPPQLEEKEEILEQKKEIEVKPEEDIEVKDEEELTSS